MTQAICFNCGTTKFGGFTPCSQCSKRPHTEEQLALSLLLTDHYLDDNEMAEKAQLIREGVKLVISPEDQQQISQTIQQSRDMYTEGLGRDIVGFLMSSSDPWPKMPPEDRVGQPPEIDTTFISRIRNWIGAIRGL